MCIKQKAISNSSFHFRPIQLEPAPINVKIFPICGETTLGSNNQLPSHIEPHCKVYPPSVTSKTLLKGDN